MTNLLIISDSAVDRMLLQKFLSKFSGLSVINTVSDEMELLTKLNPDEAPDVILIVKNKDVDQINRIIQFLKQLYNARIIVSSSMDYVQSADKSVIFYPKTDLSISNKNFDPWIKKLAQKIKGITARTDDSDSTKIEEGYSQTKKRIHPALKKKIHLIAIGSSTGGPQTLNKIFSELPAQLKVPIVVVQHMPENFLQVLIEWIKSNSALPVQIAQEGEFPLPGNIYFAPDHHHLVIEKSGKFHLIDAPPRHNVKPSVSYLFESVANVYGDKALGILLTGMGKDGAAELALMKKKGAITIAQSKKSCVVFGMPKEAIKLDGATFILSPEEIVLKIKEIFKLN